MQNIIYYHLGSLIPLDYRTLYMIRSKFFLSIKTSVFQSDYDGGGASKLQGITPAEKMQFQFHLKNKKQTKKN